MKLFRFFILAFFTTALIACGGAEERKAVYMEKAKASMEAGDFDKARIELKNVLQIDPKDGDAYYQLGKLFEQKKNYRKAYSNYLKAGELNPENLENQAKLGRVYLLLANEPEKAQKKIDFILSKDPDNIDGLLLKASMMLHRKNKSEAIKIVEKINKKVPGHVEAVAFLASLYVSDKEITDAINVLEKALMIKQGNDQLNKLLALYLLQNKDYAKSEMIYKKMLDQHPDNASGYTNLAAFYNLSGNKDKAVETLRASIENDPKDAVRQLILVKFLKEIRGDEAAISELKRLIVKYSGMGKLRIALAELLYQSGEKQEAIKVYKVAISDFFDEETGVESRILLASIYLNGKQFEKASEVVDDAMDVAPNDPKVNYLKAKLAFHDKKYEQALISLRIVVKEMPENIDAYILLADIYKKESNNEQVRSTLNSAYENNRGNADALLKLAQYYSSTDVAQSEKIIDEYNTLRVKDYDGLSLKVALLNRNRKYEEAYKIAEKLISSSPDKPNGYLQAMPYLSQQGDKKRIISILENGYVNTGHNRKLLILLTTMQASEKKFDIIESRIKEEIKLSSDDSELNILLAKVYLAKNDIKSAIAKLNAVTKSNPEAEESYLLLSQIYQKKGDVDSVEEILVNGKANVKSSLKISMTLAGLYEFNKSYNKAIDVYKSIHKMYPENLVIVNNLASMLSDYGNSEEDLKLAKTLSAKLEKAEQPAFWDTIGWVQYKSGDYPGAIEYLTRAVNDAPKVNVFNYHLGMAYKLSGDKAQAKVYLEKSLADGKEFKEKDLAKAALKEL
ncbi:MAG: tetratricopeptide repeat protein [Methylococcales bacterium]